MKLFILMMSLVLSSCEAPVDEVAKEGQQTDRIVNAACDADTVGCDMDWLVTYPRQNFPEKIQILVNGTVIFTECGDTKFHVNRLHSTVEIMMWQYRRLAPKNKTKFSFQIKTVENCSNLTKLENFDLNSVQVYSLDDDINPHKAFLKN